MKPGTSDWLRLQAIEFSNALRPIVVRENIVMLGSCDPATCFPKGGCAMASRLFGTFLADHDIGTYIVTAFHIQDQEVKHTWLETDRYLIDLTCCQFDAERPLPTCPYECPLVADKDLDWYRVNWPMSNRQLKEIRKTNSDTPDQELTREVLATMLINRS